MNAIKVTTDDVISVVEIGNPKLKCLQTEVGGHIEVVRPQGLRNPQVMIVDEEGLLKSKEPNFIGCLLYKTQQHGHPIVGDILIMLEQPGPDGYDLFGLPHNTVIELTAYFRKLLEVRDNFLATRSEEGSG